MIEPAAGVNRAMLAFLCDAYDEEVVAERERTVLRLHPQIAPVKAAVLPLIAKDAEMVSKARALHEELRRFAVVEYDDNSQIGRRYRRQDEIGTPFAFTIDEQTLEDETITVRDRDSLAQERISLARTREHLLDRLAAAVAVAEAGLTTIARLRRRRWEAPLHEALARRPKPGLLVQGVRVGGVEQPARAGERAVVDREAEELDAEPSTAMVGEDEHVGEVRVDVTVGDGAREADERIRVVEPDEACGAADECLGHLARASGGPVAVLAQVAMDDVDVDPRRVVVELVSVSENHPHGVILPAHPARYPGATVRWCAPPSLCRSRFP